MPNEVIELPRLTPKQHAYVMARVDGKGITEAYRDTYSVSDPMHPNVRKMAWAQEYKPKIRGWIDYLNDTVGRVTCTRSAHLHRLDVLGDKAEKADKYSDAIKAEELRGKATGHYNHIKQIQTASVDLNEAFDQMAGNTRTLVQDEVKTITIEDDD